MIPLRDSIPSRTFPGVTVALIAANVAVFFYQLSLGPEAADAFLSDFATVPAAFTGAVTYPAGELPPAATVLTSMFLHGGFLHLFFNMLFLWIFGNNVEDATGHVRFLVFYVLCGVAGAAAHIVTHQESIVRMIGASGAISGVLGAYFLLYPYARIITLVVLGFFAQTVRIPAFFFLGIWFLLQVLSGAATVGQRGGGVAFAAHVGGFVAGLVLLVPFKRRGVRLWNQVTG